MTILDTVLGALGEEQTRDLAQRVGAEPGQISSGIQLALPMLVSALARNASDGDGARALHAALDEHQGASLDKMRDHGSLDVDDGRRMLGHILGQQEDQAAEAVSQVSGLDTRAASQLLTMLAPLVLGALARLRHQHDLDAAATADALRQERDAIPQKVPGLAAVLANMPGRDGDGSPVDDLSALLGGRGS